MPRALRVQLSTALLFTALAVLALQLWVVARRAAGGVLHAETRVIGTQLAGRLEACVATRVALVEAMALEWAAGGLRDEVSYRARATGLLETFPGYQAINFVDPDGVIRRVHPPRGNEAALGRHLGGRSDVADELERAARTGRVQISEAIDLFQGGRGFALYAPLIDGNGAVGGFLNGVFRSSELVESCVGPVDHFVIEVRDGGTTVYRSPGESTGHATRFSVPVGSRELELFVSPTVAGAAEHSGPGIGVLVAGLLLCALVAVLYERNHHVRADRKALAEELSRARRLEALGRLAAGVAHDFNNLLTVLQFGAESLRMTRDEASRNARLDEMDRAITRAVGLTSQMLTLGRRHTARMQPTSLGTLVRGMEPLLRRLVPEGVTIEVTSDEAGMIVLGDPVRIEQIVLNLVTNAGDAYDAGGVVRITVERTGDRVELQVSDRGRGMDTATLRRMYEPFFTTKGPGAGTGLGLATVHGHVQAMNATIEVDSAPRAGTTILVSWPAFEGEAPAVAALVRPPPAVPAAAVRVLLVEDGDLVRKVARLALRGAGYDVVEATDGLEAIRVLEEDRSIAIVVTDAVMPRAGGGEVIEWAAEHRPSLPIVLVSGYADSAVTERSARRESVSFVAKPYAPTALLGAVAAALEPRLRSDASTPG